MRDIVMLWMVVLTDYKINTVSLVQDDFLALDVDKHTAFNHQIEFLSVVVVIMDRLIVSLRFDRDDERIGGAVHEARRQ